MPPGFDPGAAQGDKAPAVRLSAAAMLCVFIVLIGALVTLLFLLDLLPAQ